MQKGKKTEKQTTQSQPKPKTNQTTKPKTNFNSFEATKFLNERLSFFKNKKIVHQTCIEEKAEIYQNKKQIVNKFKFEEEINKLMKN
jgi:hypothetical protein